MDARWGGVHGIGRFANELMDRLPFERYAPRRDRLGPLEPFRLGAELRRLSPKLYFSPGFGAIVGYDKPFAVTVHDLIHLETIERGIAKTVYYEALLKPTLHRASCVFTVSEFSRDRILRWSGLAEERVQVVGNGVSAAYVASGPRVERARPYLLYVGNDKPHKNVDVLFDAFDEHGLARDFDLLLTGAPSTRRGSALSSGASWAHWLGAVSEEGLASYYRGAVALVFPSSYEGFGLPAIEAMACGTPVVASDAGALLEVCGGAALHFPMRDATALAAAVREVCDSDTRRRLVALGSANAARYDWSLVSDRVRSSIEACLA